MHSIIKRHEFIIFFFFVISSLHLQKSLQTLQSSPLIVDTSLAIEMKPQTPSQSNNSENDINSEPMNGDVVDNDDDDDTAMNSIALQRILNNILHNQFAEIFLGIAAALILFLIIVIIVCCRRRSDLSAVKLSTNFRTIDALTVDSRSYCSTHVPYKIIDVSS